MATTDEQLEARGYRKSVRSSYKLWRSTDTLFQRRFEDDNGVQYFLNAWVYPEGRYGNTEIPRGVSYQAQLYNDETFVDIDVTCDTVEEAEDMIGKIWFELGYDYYELFDGF